MMYQRCTEICQMADFYGLMLKKESGDMAIHTFAAIYIGTYDVSLKVFEFLDRKKIHQVDHIRSRLDLGQDAFSKGSIGYEHVEELCDTLAQFKEIIEWMVANPNKNIYFHCQGGCDRTGTLSFQILGLLGVSESDLAKDYELSSFSDVGLGRLRNTVKATDTYDYSGMVAAIKAYSGTTITDKFYNFAIDCGLTDTTISTFRNMMLN